MLRISGDLTRVSALRLILKAIVVIGVKWDNVLRISDECLDSIYAITC